MSTVNQKSTKNHESEFFVETTGVCLVRTQNVGFRDLKMYTYKGVLYIKNGVNYLKLRKDYGTSNPNVDWVEIMGIDYKFISGIMHVQ